mmetsp:Transcript_9259/g.24333  ORF Transcript_9259/g.24333 Transcript_9259/m.24333 type:complete len:200 (-) Transcript_9259:16-615(-)
MMQTRGASRRHGPAGERMSRRTSSARRVKRRRKRQTILGAVPRAGMRGVMRRPMRSKDQANFPTTRRCRSPHPRSWSAAPGSVTKAGTKAQALGAIRARDRRLGSSEQATAAITARARVAMAPSGPQSLGTAPKCCGFRPTPRSRSRPSTRMCRLNSRKTLARSRGAHSRQRTVALVRRLGTRSTQLVHRQVGALSTGG